MDRRMDKANWGMALGLAGCIFGWVGAAFAGNPTRQIVQLQVAPINEFAVSGDPQDFLVRVGDAALNTSTTYAITTNMDKRKITAALDAEMPSGVTLEINLTPPPGASSAGFRPLSPSAQDLVTGISRKAAGGLPINYKITVLSWVATQTGQRMVTLTLTQ